MGIIRYKDVPYGGGGSSVTPNPSGTATANLEKVTIESTIYAIKDTNAVHSTDKGVANGVASLDANAKIPSAQIPSLSSIYLPLAGGEMTGCIDTYAPPSDIMPAIMPKTEFCGSVGFSDKPYRFGFFQGMVLGATYGTGGTSVAKMGTLTMYTGLGAYAAVIKPDTSQSVSEVDLVLPKTSGTLALTSEIPTKTSDLTNDSGFITSYTDNKVSQTAASDNADYEVLFSATADNTTRTEGAKKASNLKFNPSTGNLQATQLNGVAIGNSPKFTDNNTTYSFAQGTNNGEIKITPSSGSAVTVKPKGISDLAYIAKGSGSSKFLREDGQWTTVTASWSGGTITSSILPNATETLNLGSSTKKFASGYIQYLESYTGEFRSYVKAGSIEAGKANNESGYLTMWQANSSYNAHFVPPSTAYTSNVALTLPSASGTLINDTNLAATTLASFQPTAANAFQAKTLSESMDNFVYLLFEIRQYGNTLQTLLTPVSRFKGQTSSGNRVIMQYSNTYNSQIYYSSNTQVYISQSNVSSGVYYTVIYGVGRKN